MSVYRRATQPYDPDALKAADAAVGGRTLGLGPEDADARKQWMDAYIAAGGQYVEVAPKGKGPSDPVHGCRDKPLLWVNLVSLTFTTDHGLLTDKFSASTDPESELDRWAPGGTKFADLDPKEWTQTHNFPVSQTKSTLLSVIAEFEAGPQDAAAASGSITATSESWTFVGKATFKPTNDAKTNTVKVPLKGDVLPELVQKLSESLDWEIEACGRTFTSKSGPHVVYVTYGVPKAIPDRGIIDPDSDDLKEIFPPEKLGVTLKRMDKSVEVIEPRDTTDPVSRHVFSFDAADPQHRDVVNLTRPHAIVNRLMKLFKGYELEPDKSLHNFMHPNYFNGVGGAWPIADY